MKGVRLMKKIKKPVKRMCRSTKYVEIYSSFCGECSQLY